MHTNKPSLWTFSLALYSSAPVETECLKLQDEWQANINILLWCYWLDARQVPLTPARIELAEKQLAMWNQTVVMPLRYLRRDIKQRATRNQLMEDCRQKIKSAELAAERVEQSWLEALEREWPAVETGLPHGHNALVYLTHLGVPEAVAAQMLVSFGAG